MPTKPEIVNLKAGSADILNQIRNEAPYEYQRSVGIVNKDLTSLRAAGTNILGSNANINVFLTALWNRIGRTLITSKLYENELRHFKKGMLELGETVQEIFANIGKPFQYDPAVAETDVFKRVIPDVRAVYHTMNYQKFYKDTISNDQLRQAFINWNGITDLIAKIVESMYTSANYDEYVVMKYLLCREIVDGNVKMVTTPAVSDVAIKSIITIVKATSNKLTIPSVNYNLSGVMNFCKKEEQNILLGADFDAMTDVEVLAAAFNMSKADFYGKRVMIDSYAVHDTARLVELFGNDANFVPFTQAELALLESITCCIISDDWFMVFDNFLNTTEIYNGEGLYWNYTFHTWKTFSISPFACGVAFSTLPTTVTKVTVTPANLTIQPNKIATFTSLVEGAGFPYQGVSWTVSGGTSSVINGQGVLSVPRTETSTSLTVTATSLLDSTKFGTSTVTISDIVTMNNYPCNPDLPIA